MKSSTTTKEGTMNRPAHISALHVERGSQMRSIVESDIARGSSFEAAVDSLASYLGVDAESVKLGIAIANEWGADRASDPSASLRTHNAEVTRFYAAGRS
jgi:hypothetical protein